MKRVFTAPLLCRISRTGSTPSSAKETAPIWMPTMRSPAAGAAPACAASAAADPARKLLRVGSDNGHHLVIGDARNGHLNRISTPGEREFSAGAQQTGC